MEYSRETMELVLRTSGALPNRTHILSKNPSDITGRGFAPDEPFRVLIAPVRARNRWLIYVIDFRAAWSRDGDNSGTWYVADCAGLPPLDHHVSSLQRLLRVRHWQQGLEDRFEKVIEPIPMPECSQRDSGALAAEAVIKFFWRRQKWPSPAKMRRQHAQLLVPDLTTLDRNADAARQLPRGDTSANAGPSNISTGQTITDQMDEDEDLFEDLFAVILRETDELDRATRMGFLKKWGRFIETFEKATLHDKREIVAFFRNRDRGKGQPGPPLQDVIEALLAALTERSGA